MSNNFFTSPPALAQLAMTATSALMLLTIGVSFTTRLDVNCPTCNGVGNNIQTFQTKSGSIIRQKGLFTASGSLIGSGSVAVARNEGTNASGALVIYNYAKVCMHDRSGAGWTLCTYQAGTQTCVVAGASECPPKTL